MVPGSWVLPQRSHFCSGISKRRVGESLGKDLCMFGISFRSARSTVMNGCYSSSRGTKLEKIACGTSLAPCFLTRSEARAQFKVHTFCSWLSWPELSWMKRWGDRKINRSKSWKRVWGCCEGKGSTGMPGRVEGMVRCKRWVTDGEKDLRSVDNLNLPRFWFCWGV